MALSDLDANDKKVYEYLKLYDFVENPWSTKKAAKALKMKEDEVYQIDIEMSFIDEEIIFTFITKTALYELEQINHLV